MAYILPPLPYAYDALEPYIDAETMRLRHDTYHATYVANLNAALAGYPDLATWSVEGLVGHLDRIPSDIRAVVRDSGGGHANYSFFWATTTPNRRAWPERAESTGVLDEDIARAFGSLDAFRARLTAAALGSLGSSWTWLSLDGSGALRIESTANQDSPLMEGRIPIVGVDMWEHSYYLRYRYRRADYLAAWWQVIDWAEVATRYEIARDSMDWPALVERYEAVMG